MEVVKLYRGRNLRRWQEQKPPLPAGGSTTRGNVGYADRLSARLSVGPMTVRRFWWWFLIVGPLLLLPVHAAHAITVVGAAGSTGGTYDSVTLNSPSNTAAGDLLIAQVTFNNAATVSSVPSGWTEFTSCAENGGSGQIKVYYNQLSAPASSSYQWQFSTTAYASGGIIAYRGAASGNPLDVCSVNAGNSGTGIAKSVTTTVDGDIVIAMYTMSDSTTCTLPLSSEVNVAGVNNSYWGTCVSDETVATHGATGDLDATFSTTNGWNAVQVAIKPAPATATPTATPVAGGGGGGGCTVTPNHSSGEAWWLLVLAMSLWWARRVASGA